MPTYSVTRRFRALNADNFYNSMVGESFVGVGSLSGNTLTVTSAIRGTIRKGQFLFGQRITSGTTITVSNTTGGLGTHRVNNTQTVSSNNISTSFNTTNRLYVYIARPMAWPTESSPPSPNTSLQAEQFDYYRDMIAMKRVLPSDIRFMSARYNWANNTVYTQYTDTNQYLPSNTFYIMTSSDRVYKCIDNNYGAVSTVEPTSTSSSIVTTADSYRWKYMFTISTGEATKFRTSAYIPVKTLVANDASAQWVVQTASANGAIHHIVVSAAGNNYHLLTNSFSTVTNSTSFVLGSYGSTAVSAYANSSVFISSGAGSGQLKRITAYTGSSTKVLTVNNAFSPSPNTSSKFIIGPTVVIRGDSGKKSGTLATAYVSRPMNAVTGISRITMVSEGLHYSTANVTFNQFAGTGTGAAARPIISPPGIHGAGALHGSGGHGSDPVAELYGQNIMISVSLTGIEANTFPANNDFRIVGILRDPLLRAGTTNYANATVIDLTTRLTVNVATGSGGFIADEVITGGTSTAKGRLVIFANTNTSRTKGIVKLIRVSPSGLGIGFTAGETITGASSGYTANVVSIALPAIKEYTGDVIYTENRTPVTRDPEQTEIVRALVKF